MPPFHHETHDALPAEAAAVVDQGLDTFNAQAAPLHEVMPLSCFVRDDTGRVVGGAVGRRWGSLCELQQLWVDERHRGAGLGAALMAAFEHRAIAHGCRVCVLETLSFQAPGFYRRLGYRTVLERDDYPHGIHKHYMRKALAAPQTAAD